MKASTNRFFVLIVLLALLVPIGQVWAGGAQESGGAVAEASEGPIEFDLFVNHTWFWTDEWKGAIAEEITSRTGVTMDVTKANDNQQLPVMIASGNLPDFVYASGDMVTRMSDSRISYPWNELIPEHAPDFPLTEIEVANNTMPDGNFYTLLNAFATEQAWRENEIALPSPGTHSLSFRVDIWEELGQPSMTTLEEYEDVLMSVRDEYPDMVPLVLGWSGTAMYGYFAAQFGMDVGSNPVYEDDGQIYHRIRHPALVDTLVYLNRLVRNGLLVPENFTYQHEQFLQQVNSGRAFSFTRSAWQADEANTAYQQAQLPFSARVLPNELSADAVLVNDGIGWSGTFITRSNDDPARAIQFMSFMRSEEGRRLSVWGVEGVHWNEGPDGRPVFTDVYYDAQEAGTFYDEILGGVWTFGMSALEEAIQSYDPENRSYVTERLVSAKEITIYRPELYFTVPRTDSEERNILTRIQELSTNEEVRIIISAESEEEVRTMYESMIDRAESIGLGQLEEWMNDEYASVQDRYE
ncbi:MAG: extracellular solute-binding protein [Spirochaetota bacterium]